MSPSPKTWSLVVVSSLAFAVALTSSSASAADSVDECVRLASVPVAQGVSLEVDNNCSRSLSCRLTWTVACESEPGKVTRTKNGGASFVVASSGTGKALASTSDCGEGWRVDDVRWACNPTK